MGIGSRRLWVQQESSVRALLEMCACWNWSMRVPVTNGCYKGFLRPYCRRRPHSRRCPSNWAGGNTDPFCFPPNFPSPEAVLAGEPNYVESEFCGKLVGEVALGTVDWALVLEALLGQ